MEYIKSDKKAFLESYFGKTLDEIAEWYPSPITKNAILDELIQRNMLEELSDVLAYDTKNRYSYDINDDEQIAGLLTFIEIAEHLAKRVLFAAYVVVDGTTDKIKAFQREVSMKTAYTTDFFDSYTTELDGGKRFITKNEFIDFLECAVKNENTDPLFLAPFTLDSLYYCLSNRIAEFGIDDFDITRKYLTKGTEPWNHTGPSNDLIKYRQFYKSAKVNKALSDKAIIIDFFYRGETDAYIDDEPLVRVKTYGDAAKEVFPDDPSLSFSIMETSNGDDEDDESDEDYYSIDEVEEPDEDDLSEEELTEAEEEAKEARK